jgi:surfactin synthase thioesterase subunit
LLTIKELIDELKEIILTESDYPVVLIGHSWGAWLRFMTAAFAEIVSKLVIVASILFEEKYEPIISQLFMVACCS